MANWSDPRTGATRFATASGARSEAFDAGLRSYMLSVYNYMASGILLTGIVSLAFAWSGYAAQIFQAPGFLKYALVFAPLAVALPMILGQGRLAVSTLQKMFWALAVAMGLSISYIFLIYSQASIAGAFFAAAAAFAGVSLYGYTTKRDLSPFGRFLLMGLFGLIAAALLAAVIPSAGFNLVYSAMGVLIISAVTAFHTQRTKSLYLATAGTADEDRAVIMSALALYMDFINMFMFILRLFGSSRN